MKNWKITFFAGTGILCAGISSAALSGGVSIGNALILIGGVIVIGGVILRLFEEILKRLDEK